MIVCLWVAWFSFDQITDCLQIRVQLLLPSSKVQAAVLPETKAFELSPCQQWMLKEKYKIILIGFFFAMLFLYYISQRSGQFWKSHLLAAPCLTSCKSWGQSLWNRQDNLICRNPKCESRFHHISINLLFKGIENSFVHWLKESNYHSPQLKGRSGNGCWLFFSFICFCEWLLRTAGLSGFVCEHTKNPWNRKVFRSVLLE